MNTKPVICCICILPLSILSFAESPADTLRSPVGASSPQVESTAEQRQRIIRVTKVLEAQPFGESAAADREWAISLIDHAPDIFPLIHGNKMYSQITEAQGPDRRALHTQFVFGFVSFQLEHPKQAGDSVAVYEAAIKSCLLIYRQARERNAANRVPFLDAADEHERSGTLRRYVEQRVTEDLASQRSD
jgi:hypothetical protein